MGIKDVIKNIISSNKDLSNDYDILLSDKTGYMTNYVENYCDSNMDKHFGNATRYFIANNPEHAKQKYTDFINAKVKDKFEETTGRRISHENFHKIMREVIDDMKCEEQDE